jgi:hypothetical protein
MTGGCVVLNPEKESMKFKPRRGGVRLGAGRPKGVLNKATADVKAQAGHYSPDALKTLVDIMLHGESEQARIAASKEVLDRAHGRPRQEIDLTDDGKVTVVICRPTRPVLDVQPAITDHSTGEAETTEAS